MTPEAHYIVRSYILIMSSSSQQEVVPSHNVNNDAKRIVRHLAEQCNQDKGFGSFSISIYDTAWLAMIRAPGQPGRWLFPESFSYLLLSQTKEGMWPTYASPIDGILNTLAGLLALVKHRKSDVEDLDSTHSASRWDLPSRIEKARRALELALDHWNVNQTLHVGFEMLVPSLLSQLGEEGLFFQFEGRSALFTLHQKKLSTFIPDIVISPQPTTLLHSLEALVGVVDFGLLKHHCTEYGGMFGSPASTAAYLLYSPEWDSRAQTYLENVIRSYGSSGGVPSGFPTPIFEVSWVISTMLACGFHVDDFHNSDLEGVTEYLRKAIRDQGGVLGFAPRFLPDADDTSKSLLALTALGVQIDRAPLVRHFEGSDHFRTYQLERDSSVSANCNVLLALLTSANVDEYVSQIDKIANFLCTSWNADRLQDKWNLAAEYTNMLLASAFSKLLHVWDQGLLRTVAGNIIEIDVPIILVQLLGRTIRRQGENGSWDDSVEKTSYGILLISHALKLPWHLLLRQHAEAAYRKAKTYLESHSSQWETGEYLWIEKVTYRCPTISEAYCLSAMKSSVEKQSWSAEVERIFGMAEIKIRKMCKFFSQLPLLHGLSEADTMFAVYEGILYANRLKEIRLEIFPRDDMDMSGDKYLEYIPIAWTTINATLGNTLSSEQMWDMMMISMLNYQVDEYMESVVARLPGTSLKVLDMIIGAEIRGRDSAGHLTVLEPRAHMPLRSECGSPAKSLALEDVAGVLSRYIRHVKQHKILLQSPKPAQLRVMQELEKFLLAHIAHNADNASIKGEKDGLQAPGGEQDSMPYYDWVHTTGANDTSCPYSFAFFCCLISESGCHCLFSMEQRYLARELCLHLAVLCRQYNDYGSSIRDDAEGNLNSLRFPEFSDEWDQSHSSLVEAKAGDNAARQHSLEKAKELLMKVAGVERACMQICWDMLSPTLDESIRTKLKAFIDVTDLFGQIYVARDIASRVQK